MNDNLCGGPCEPASELCAHCGRPVREAPRGRLRHLWLLYPTRVERERGERRVYAELDGGDGYTLLLSGLSADPLESEIRLAALAKLRALRRGEVEHD